MWSLLPHLIYAFKMYLAVIALLNVICGIAASIDRCIVPLFYAGWLLG
jgi:hypothetical protein